jgi:S-DNA-T family DNA segregation ATPase FtsK/SpoIIIE
MVLAPTGKTLIQSSAEKLQIFNDTESCVTAVRDIFNVVLNRNNEYKDALEAGGELPKYEHLFVIIQSIALLKTMLERYKPKEDEQKAATDDTLLNRLQLAMVKSAKEYNVHFIVAESINALNPFSIEDWYKTHINGNSGIWVGSGIQNQHRLTINKRPADASAEFEADFGFIVNNANATLVKLLQ